jgi:pyruvate dehydrogenase E1 component beta subunit
MRKDGVVPEGFYQVPLGKGIHRRRGNDVTIVGASHAIELGMQAAVLLAEDGIQADVIDLRTIKPLDEEIVLDSLKNTGRIVVVDTGWMKGGVCAEIGCLAAEKGFRDLKAPVCRIGLPDVPTPAGYTLEQFYYPDARRIASRTRDLVRFGIAAQGGQRS